ncbi:MAG: ABC transporter permease subunit [Acholeplasmatales bacterium]|nr:ABC transporter permease subunit [Acholeplasmatales bacterium]
MSSTTKKRIENLILFIIGIILIGVILQLLSMMKNDNFLFPNVFEIIKSFFILLGQGQTYIYILWTLLHLLISFMFSFIIGFALGMIAGFHPRFATIMKPMMIFLRSIPIIVLLVIIMFLLDYSYTPVVSATLILIPIIYENVKNGIANIDQDFKDVYRLQSNFNHRVLLRVYVPLISSNIKTAISNMVGMGIKVIVTTEYISGANNTLGKAIILEIQNMNYELIYAYSIIMVLIVVLVEWLPVWIFKLINLILYGKNTKIES